jgi:hypothetical protein
MDIGMLWFDDDARRTLDEKVARAVEHYRTKYGVMPTVCFVHPSLLAEKRAPDLPAGVQVRPARTVMKHHFWVGVAEAPPWPADRGGQAQRKNGNGARKYGSGARKTRAP